MKARKEFDQFAEEIFESLKNVPFKELDSYEGQIFGWKKGWRQGAVSVAVEIISPAFKRVILQGQLPGRFFIFSGHPFKRGFRAYESGVRVPEVEEEFRIP